MGLQGMLLGRKAYKAHGNGEFAKAMELYEQAWNAGMDNPRWILGYTILLLRDGQYAKAREILVKLQNNPMLSPDQKTQLFVNYAAAVYRMGELEKGVRLLERQHSRGASGLLYQTLGYLYVEKFVPENTPDFEAQAAEAREKAEAEAAEKAAKEALAEGESAEGAVPETPSAEDLRAEWQAAMDKAEAFLRESIDYDDEDSVCLDNMAQWLYRVKGDKAGAKEWFEKALQYKPNQIDSLWFLSRYDLEAGDRAAARKKVETLSEGRFSPLNYCTRAMAEEELARLKG